MNTSLGPEDNKARANLLTLIFTHASGAHKEWWEPIIHRLFEQQCMSGGLLRFQDMWTIDMPNHGDSAVLNEEVLAWGYNTFSWGYYARCIHAFLAGLGSGVDVDFSKRNLAAVGLCIGSVSLISSTTFSPPIKFSSIHLIESPILGKHAEGHGWHLEKLMLNRRDVWDSVEEVYESFKRSAEMKQWDDRVVRIHAATFRERGTTLAASRYLPHMLRRIPTHMMWAEIPNIL
ncbi:hypothetical protein JVU11DRAFT_3435 [Chiua virens]|nr:hypothetical protein JVU11DRAFT_3435 [Chiua virens]